MTADLCRWEALGPRSHRASHNSSLLWCAQDPGCQGRTQEVPGSEELGVLQAGPISRGPAPLIFDRKESLRLLTACRAAGAVPSPHLHQITEPWGGTAVTPPLQMRKLRHGEDN